MTSPELDASPQVLIVEDDLELQEILVSGLRHFGVPAMGVGDGVAMDAALARTPLRVLVLDIGLPGEDGLSIARRLRRSHGPDLGIIMLSARGAIDDRVLGLRDGADIYFVKPVDLQELALTVRNLNGRLVGRSRPQTDAFNLDLLRSSLQTPGGIRVPLTARELGLLRLFLDSTDQFVGREEILRTLDHAEDLAAMQRLETLVSRLRSKLRKADPDAPLPLKARHGSGYAFLAPLRVVE